MTTASARQCSFWLAAALACGLAANAQAEVQVEGTPERLRVTTQQDAIGDVLSALTAPFNMTYRTSVPLDAAAHASYTGSFREVISRLLDRYNYVVRMDRQTTEVIVVGRRGDVAVPRPITRTSPPSVVSRWK
jgi:hypothetical protein